MAFGRKLLLGGTLALTMLSAAVQPVAAQRAAIGSDAQALEIAQRAIAFRSVAGAGNQTPQLAAYLKSVLVAGGFAADDVSITPVDDTAYLVARWRGSDPAAKPLVVSGHIDVVEAKPADWQRDPFTPVVENGYLYGRGATDMKLDAAVAITALLKMKRDGFRPRRDIVLEFSGDEETRMKTSALIAEQFKNAELVINIDGGGGRFGEDGKPQFFTWNGAEKTYADFELTVTNPGGHSSAPRPQNAINQLSAALVRIGQYRFTPQTSEVTRTFFREAAKQKSGELAAAMRAFAENPRDEKAIAVLAADPAYVGQIGTTCVSTMVSGGHALNALPQRATANINCRIFPGVKPADVMATLRQVAAEPALTIRDVSEGSVPNDASPMRADFVAAVTKAAGKAWPGVPVFPSMSAGASDSMWFRYHHVPSYGASPTFIKESDDFSHGLNERTEVRNIAPGIRYYVSLFGDLAK
ncbi:M20/M25/M40 family metallo-hydrolase [Sphingomonas sp. DT-51]|uniref:M20/M25/M40 family metallo-hydrolase n=1 Tax=Sphingomonas sp. DT-51 TaxID=3396165 RepID=UPI003F1A4794